MENPYRCCYCSSSPRSRRQIRAVAHLHVSRVDVGEMGDIQPNHDWALVELAGLQYSQPVVFLGTPMQSGNEEACRLYTFEHLVGENIHRYSMSLTNLKCQASKLVNSDTCPRPTPQAVMHVRNTQYGGAFPDGTACPDSPWCFQVRPQDAFASRVWLINLYALVITGNNTYTPCFSSLHHVHAGYPAQKQSPNLSSRSGCRSRAAATARTTSSMSTGSSSRPVSSRPTRASWRR
jgi:hypothetical protein